MTFICMSLFHISHACCDTFSKIFCPTSPPNGGFSKPGSSCCNFEQFTVLDILLLLHKFSSSNTRIIDHLPPCEHNWKWPKSLRKSTILSLLMKLCAHFLCAVHNTCDRRSQQLFPAVFNNQIVFITGTRCRAGELAATGEFYSQKRYEEHKNPQ